jgi:hypothetical protein
MGTSTEKFSDRKCVQKIDGNWTASRGFVVIDFTDENDAVNCTGVTVGQPHPLNSNLICTHIGMSDNKLSLTNVIASYEISSLLDNPLNPIARQPIIRWKWGKVAHEADTDLNGKAILNSAYDAFRSNGRKNFSVRYLTITRYEPYYNQPAAENYTDTTNSASITFEGNTFGAGQMYCLSIAPTSDYQEGATYIQIAYAFEIRTPSPIAAGLTTAQKRYPFQRRILDQGMRAQYLDPLTTTNKLGNLYFASGEPVNRDVLLNGNGQPIDTSIKVTQGQLAAVSQTVPPTTILDPSKDAGGATRAMFLIYMDYPEVDFNGIGLT